MLGPQHRGKFDSESERKDVTYLKQWKKCNYWVLYLIVSPIQLFIYNMLGCGVSVLLLLFLLCGSTFTKVINQVSQQPHWPTGTFLGWSFAFLHQCLSFTFRHLKSAPSIFPSRKEKDHFIQVNRYVLGSETATAAKHTSTISVWIWSTLFYIFKCRNGKTHTGSMQAFKWLIRYIHISILHKLS